MRIYGKQVRITVFSQAQNFHKNRFFQRFFRNISNFVIENRKKVKMDIEIVEKLKKRKLIVGFRILKFNKKLNFILRDSKLGLVCVKRMKVST
jgi:hypothetical protein